MSVNYPRGSGRRLQDPFKARAAASESQAAPDLTLMAPPDTPAAKKNRHLEAAEQMAYMDQVRLCLDQSTDPPTALPHRPGADLIFALANENSSGVKAIGVTRWRMGIKPGLPDIGVFVPAWYRDDHHCGLFLEFKREDGVASDVRPTQRIIHAALAAAGYHVVVAYGWRRAWAVTCDYLGWRG